MAYDIQYFVRDLVICAQIGTELCLNPDPTNNKSDRAQIHNTQTLNAPVLTIV